MPENMDNQVELTLKPIPSFHIQWPGLSMALSSYQHPLPSWYQGQAKLYKHWRFYFPNVIRSDSLPLKLSAFFFFVGETSIVD